HDLRQNRQIPFAFICVHLRIYFYSATALSQCLQRATESAAVCTSVTTATLSAPAASTPGARSGVNPPIATNGMLPTLHFQRATRSNPWGAHFIFLSLVGYTGPSAI